MRLDSDRLAMAAGEAGLGVVSSVVRSLDTEATADLEPDLELYPASMIKVPLVAAALSEIATGHLPALESTVEVSAANMTANDAGSPFVPGHVATLRETMHAAISRSDNVATNVLFDVVGRERATEVVRDRFQLNATSFHRKLSGSEPLITDPHWDGINRNVHPASDCARLFSMIARDVVPQAALLRNMLAAQIWNEKLSKGLLGGDRFLHKTGDTSEVTHDGGILTLLNGNRYVVVVYTALQSTDENNVRFGAFMERIRELL